MDFTAVNQQQKTGYGAHQNSFAFGIVSLSWGNCPVIGLVFSVQFSTEVKE
jgi:hypothetical protein